MGLWKQIRRIFNKDDRYQNKRTFKEIVRVETMDEALEIKKLLEKSDIPVYLLDLRNLVSQNKGKSNIVLRIPGKFINQAKEILKPNE